MVKANRSTLQHTTVRHAGQQWHDTQDSSNNQV